MLLGLIIAASAGASVNDDMIVPVDYTVVSRSEVRVPISDSVRATTWDDLAVKPTQPVQLHLACIVFVPSGAPGGCIPASFIKPGQKMVDWPKVFAAAERATVDAELLKAATRRIAAARVAAPAGGKAIFAVRFFDEVVSPSDERPPLALTLDQDLTMRDVALAEPLNPSLMKALYPPVAMRYSVNARVRVTCKIETNLTLLCRDPGVIEAQPHDIGEYTYNLMEALRFSTYQLASTIRFHPKTNDGRDVAGRNFRFAVRWSMPEK